MSKGIFQKWWIFSLMAALFWGVWGVVAKVNAEITSPFMNHALFTIGMLFTLPFLAFKKQKKAFNRRGFVWAITAGFLAVAGNIAVYYAFAEGGLATIVIPVTSLYPIITVGIALIFFKEKLQIWQILGIVLSIPALLMLSGQSLIFNDISAFGNTLKLDKWFIYSLLALVFWGLFSSVQKVATTYISAEWAYLGFILASTLVSIYFLVSGKIIFDLNLKAISIGILAGVLNGIGVLFSFSAYQNDGKSSVVTVMIGVLQQIFTIVFAFIFLKEKIGNLTLFGILIATVGAILISYEKKENRTYETRDRKFKRASYLNTLK